MPSPPHTLFSGAERPPGWEHRQAPEQLPFRIGQQLIAPVHGCFECPLPRDGCARAAREQPESILQPDVDLIHRQDRHACRGQLDRERNTIETAADLCDHSRVGRSHRQTRFNGGRTLDEESGGLGLERRVGAESRQRLGQRQRRDAADCLSRHSERFTARRDNPQRRRPSEQRLSELGTGIDQVFAVVQHEENLTIV